MAQDVVPGLEFAFAAFVAIGTPLEVGPVAAEEAEEEVRAPAAKVLLQVLLSAGCRC